MGNNLFYGTIPQSLQSLRGIQWIDFSHNNLSGKIPDFFTNVSFLQSLDLSYNDLDGKVPEDGIFKNASAISVRGNKKLCGGIKELHLRVCNEDKVERSGQSHSRNVTIIIAFGEAPALSRRTMQWKRLDCLVSVLTIALSCCAPLPKDRAAVSDVVKKMIDVRHLFCRAA
ncbi:non-specific serine/threonine protein kinase [Ranunculus cassubicifolius]